MKRFISVVCIVFLCFLSSAQTVVHQDPEIGNMVSEVSSDSLQSYISMLVSFHTRHTLSTQTDGKKGIGAARNYVLNKFEEFSRESNGRLTSYIDTITLHPDGKRVDRKVVLGNVMAVLKGTDNNDKRIVIVSGHLDSRRSNVMDSTGYAPGANDDASGVAAVLECARIMSRKTFPATVIFVAVSGEEQGLLGSNFLAEKAKLEHWNITAMLNNDMIGNNNSSETEITDNTKLRVFSEGIPMYETEKNLRRILTLGLENDNSSRQLARYIKETGERYVDNLEVILEYRTDRFLRGGDHLPFLQRGFTAVRLTEMYENFIHQHQDIRTEDGINFGDELQYIDFEYLRKNTAVNLATLCNLAKAPAAPVNVRMEMKDISNKTVLKWNRVDDKTAFGYYVLMRPTAASQWTEKFFTKELNMTLPYSKDNYFFAVQSVSSSGNESLPVLPEVER